MTIHFSGGSQLKTIKNTIHQLTVPTPFDIGDVHLYLLEGEILSLIDAGVNTGIALAALEYQLANIGYALEDIEQVILTHHHPDHTGLLNRLPNVKTVASDPLVDAWLEGNQKFLNRYTDFFRNYFVECGVPEKHHHEADHILDTFAYAGSGAVNRHLREGDRLPGHPEWLVIETKGHAQSHLSFFRETDGTFIGGDHLIKHISPNPIIEAPLPGTTTRPKPMLQYRESLKKCRQLPIEVVLPGHGEKFHQPGQFISKRLISQERRAGKVYKLLQKREQTPFEICTNLFPQQFASQLSLTMSETLGQLDYLEDEGLIIQQKTNGVISYYAKEIAT